MKAEHTFEKLDSPVVMHNDTQNEFHCYPSGVVKLDIRLVRDKGSKFCKSEFSFSIECVGIHDFNAIDLDGRRIENEELSEEDKNEIADIIFEVFFHNEEFRNSVMESSMEEVDRHFPQNKNNKTK